jgi:hypothetical protein
MNLATLIVNIRNETSADVRYSMNVMNVRTHIRMKLEDRSKRTPERKYMPPAYLSKKSQRDIRMDVRPGIWMVHMSFYPISGDKPFLPGEVVTNPGLPAKVVVGPFKGEKAISIGVTGMPTVGMPDRNQAVCEDEFGSVD